MKRGPMHAGHRAGLGVLLAAALLATTLLPLGLGGCGEKIAIPEVSSVWANLAYSAFDTFTVEGGVRQLITNWGNVYLLTGSTLQKRSQDFAVLGIVDAGLDPRVLCADESGKLLFVYDSMLRAVKIYESSDLTLVGGASVPDVWSCRSMVTSTAGIDTVAGGRTYLYLSDGDQGLIHRYAVMGSSEDDFVCSECLLPAGVLAWPTGAGARSVHDPGGLARDSEGRLLVCERDPERNWVIRFDSAPDLTDATAIQIDPEYTIEAWAGKAVIFGYPSCEPIPASDFVLGSAPGCENPAEWVGGPSSEEGEFDLPVALTIDGEGKIYVADFGNSRIQIFDALGDHQAEFSVGYEPSNPTNVGTVDVLGQNDGRMHYAAYVFVVTEGSNDVIKMISAEHYLDEFGELPIPDDYNN